MIATARLLNDASRDGEVRNFEVGNVPDVLCAAFFSITDIRFERVSNNISAVFVCFINNGNEFCITGVVACSHTNPTVLADALCIEAIKQMTGRVHELNKGVMNARCFGFDQETENRIFGRM